ncbi:hypothetical protein MNBD_PLANCTO02-488 [hydrothermal vent metagenome]|uniref:Replication initiation factor n=1 Tax=hydrothermal vent metagenome TaxID=652676 RepID=A0A3B1E433_9ZZZZ
MNDNKSNTYRKDQPHNNLPESHLEDHSNEDIMPDDSPNLRQESERGTPEKDGASDSRAESVKRNLASALKFQKGGESSNTPPTNLHCPSMTLNDTLPLPALSTGGLDWLGLSLYGFFEDDYWKEFCVAFDKAQKFAQENNIEKSFVKLSESIIVPIGASGRGNGNTYCKWFFQYQGITFRIRQCQKALASDKSPPNVYVEIPSMPLMTYGEKGALKLVKTVLNLLGYKIARMSPSRVDMCVDLVDLPMSIVAEALRKRCYVSNIKKFNTFDYDGVVETIQAGSPKSKTSLRIYNKYAECKKDLVKLSLLTGLRWGKRPDPELGAIRVEFQIRRDALRDKHSIITYDDLVKKRASLAIWLTYNWFRITETESDPNHTERFGPSEFWQKVINAFANWTGQPIEERTKRIIIGADASHLIAQAIGCLNAAIAAKGICPNDVKELQAILNEIMQSHYPKMVEDIALKRKLLEATQPITIVPK